VKHFRVFGCVAHVHIPDAHRKKLDNKSTTCVLLGVSEESKAYKLYNPTDKKIIIISRDVVFEEEKGWNWGGKESVKQDNALDDDTSGVEVENSITNSDDEVASENEIVNDNEEENNINDHHDSEYDSEDSNDLPPRTRNPPGYLRDYVTGLENVDNQMQNLAIALFSSNEDPCNYEEASKTDVWRKAMDSEIQSIESNKT
jgi:hypothetical protein